jgi:excisionase family DNA binding protein
VTDERLALATAADALVELAGIIRRLAAATPQAPAAPAAPVARLLTRDEVAERLHVHHSTLLRWVRQRRFPAPVEIGGARGWTESDLASLLEDARWERDRKRGRAA